MRRATSARVSVRQQRRMGSGLPEVGGRCHTTTRVFYAAVLAGCFSFKASCGFAVSSSDGDVL